jgi:hypothetical protein
MRTLLVTLLIAALSAPAAAQTAGAPAGAVKPKPHFFFGGGIGLQFGDVDLVEVAPLVGVQFNARLSGGVQLLYRSRSDDRVSPKITASDYGADLFARFVVLRPFFVEAEYEYLDSEYAQAGGGSFRDSASTFLAGAGYMQKMGPNSIFYASALYDFSYDSNDVYTPYADPWIYRAGVTFGF